MKKSIVTMGISIGLILAGVCMAISAEQESKSLINGISISPYYTLGFAEFNGKATSGVGLDVGLNLSKTVQVVSFIESDDADHSLVDRCGLGLQMTGKLGRWLKPYARLSGGHVFDSKTSLDEDSFFLRPEFGGIIDIWRNGIGTSASTPHGLWTWIPRATQIKG